MAKNNGSDSSRSSPQSQNARDRQRSGSPRKRSRASTSSRASNSSSSGRRRRAKSDSDARSPITRGYRTGRERGMAAVESVKSVGARAVETVGEHPVPAALIGVGLAWLLLENSGIRPRQVRVLQRSRDAMSGVGQTVTEAAGTAGHAIVQAVGTAADTLVQGASAAGEYVSEATSAAREATSNGYETIGSFWERHPLAMSAAVLSAGIAAGMLLPVTARESSLMGDTATNVVRKVRRKGSELVEEGRRLATTGVKAAAREGLRQGITGGEIVHKMKRIARSARKAVTA